MDACEARWIASVASPVWACGPKGCVAGTVRLDFAGWEPAGGDASCRTVAGSLRCPCGPGGRAVAPLWLPSVRHVPVARRESVYGQSALRLPEGRPGFAPARMSPRRGPPSPPVRFRVTCTCRVFTRRGRVRVPRFRRRCAVPLVRTRTGRSNVPLGSSGLGSGRDYRGRRRRLATCAGWCVRKQRECGARAMPSSRGWSFR